MESASHGTSNIMGNDLSSCCSGSDFKMSPDQRTIVAEKRLLRGNTLNKDSQQKNEETSSDIAGEIYKFWTTHNQPHIAALYSGLSDAAKKIMIESASNVDYDLQAVVLQKYQAQSSFVPDFKPTTIHKLKNNYMIGNEDTRIDDINLGKQTVDKGQGELISCRFSSRK